MRTSILLLNERYGNKGITERYIEDFAELFTDLGYQITLAYGHKQPFHYSNPIIGEFPIPCLAERWRPAAWDELRRLEDLAAEHPPQLVLAHNIFDPGVIDSLRRTRPGLPVVWFAHDSFFHTLNALKSTPFMVDDAPRDLDPDVHPTADEKDEFVGATGIPPGRYAAVHSWMMAAGRFDQVVTTSPWAEKALAQYLPSPTVPVHLLPRQVRNAPRRQQRSREAFALFPGPIVEESGFAELIVGAPLLRNIPALRLVFAGEVHDANYLAYCQMLADELTEENGAFEVAFLPDPEGDIVDGLCEKAALLLVAGHQTEPFPALALEAMAHGVPAVAYALEGMEQYVQHGETGLLAPPGNLAGLLENVTHLLGNKALASQLGAGACAFVEREFQPRAHVAGLDRILEELLYPERAAQREERARATRGFPSGIPLLR